MTVQYKCNVCNRFIDVTENKQGLDVFGKCIITKQCKGTLFFVKRNDNILRNLPPEPTDVPDWVYTPQVVTFTQKHARSIWKFKHTLTAVPSLSVFNSTVDANNNPLNVKLNDTDYTYTFTNDYLELHFNSKISGMVQCIARNTSSVIHAPKQNDSFVKVSVGNVVSVGVHTHNKLFVAGNTGVHSNALSILLNEVQIDYDLGYNEPVQAWGNVNQIYLYGNTYNVSTFSTVVDDPNTPKVHNYSAYRYVGEDPMMYILLSNSSSYVDKIYDKIVNIFELNIDNNYIKNNELYVSPSIIRECFPHIKLI